MRDSDPPVCLAQRASAETRAAYDAFGSFAMAHAARSTSSASTWRIAPSWSTDASQITFVECRRQRLAALGPCRLVTISEDGTGRLEHAGPTFDTQLGAFPGTDPLSPDGTRLAYGCKFGDDFEVCVSDTEGANEQRITEGAMLKGWGLSWSPDGTRIAFSCDFEICIVSADGTELSNLTGG